VADRIEGELVYASALFEHSTLQRQVGYLQRMLRAMVSDETQTVQGIELLSEAERACVLVQWNQVKAAMAGPAWVHCRFEAQARARAQAIALVDGSRSVSYGELNARANQLAHRLRRLGVGPESRVGLCAQRGVALVVGILGILKAGGAYVPLDPAYPVARLRYMLEDSAPRVLLSDESAGVREVLAALGDVGVPVEGVSGHECSEQPRTDLAVEQVGLQGSHLAYVIYTSGSSGQPKGVMVEHRQVSRLLDSTQQWFEFDARDVWTLFHSYAFDFSVWELWGALSYGGRLVVVPTELSRAPQQFYQLLCEQAVTVLNQTPSAFRQLLQAQSHSGQAHRLRVVIFGGEALEMATLKPWYQREQNRATQLINMYGITETTVHVTHAALQASEVQWVGCSPIGRRLPDLRIYVLDERLQAVGIGVAGEIYVGGAGVSRGYQGQPRLTAQRFVPDPYSEQAGARMYQSGDVGRYRADGSLEYLGRNDEQVKIRGHRIELGEIEARLLEVAGVNEAAVVARQERGEATLVAYVRGRASAQSLRAHLQAVLPQYMVPSAYVSVASLPLTSNGKLDRGALPEPDEAAYVRGEYQAPQGELEQRLSQIWASVLQLQRVGRHDNFFELGGHSLLAVRLIEAMRQGQLHTDVRTLFSAPTVAALAVVTEELRELIL
jgi:amino acid adenylation domain-containing protein